MDWGTAIGTVIGSAAIGAMTSSVITEFGRERERKSRREELALTKATELAQSTYAKSIELMKTGIGVTVPPQTMMIRDAYRMFKYLLDHGELDPVSQKELEEELQAHAAKRQRPL